MKPEDEDALAMLMASAGPEGGGAMPPEGAPMEGGPPPMAEEVMEGEVAPEAPPPKQDPAVLISQLEEMIAQLKNSLG